MIARFLNRAGIAPALLVVCLAAALAGCGGPAGFTPDGNDGFGPAAPNAATGGDDFMAAATGQMTWSLSLTEFGIAPSRAYENFTLEVNLVHEADDPQPPVNESAPFGTDGTASITVALAIGQWRLVHLTVYEGEIRRLGNTEEVTFLVNPGQNTPVHVVMEEVAGTATFDITLDDSPTTERLTSVDGTNLSAHGTHQFTLDTRGADSNVWAYTVGFRCYRSGDNPDTAYQPCGGVRLAPGQNFVTTGEDWQVYVDTMGSTYADGSTVTWQTGIRVRPGLLVEFEVDFGYILDNRHYQYDWQGQPSDYTAMQADLWEIRQTSPGAYEGALVEPAIYQIDWSQEEETSDLAGHVVIRLSDRLLSELEERFGPTLVVRANLFTGGLNDDYVAWWMTNGQIDLGEYNPGHTPVIAVVRANNAAYTWAWWQVALVQEVVDITAEQPTVITID